MKPELADALRQTADYEDARIAGASDPDALDVALRAAQTRFRNVQAVFGGRPGDGS